MKYDRKTLAWGLSHAAIIIGFRIYAFIAQESQLTRSGLHFYSAFCLIVALLRWLFMYDAYKPSADVFGVGFSKRTFPHYVEGQPKMNAIMVRVYVWFVIVLFGLALVYV